MHLNYDKPERMEQWGRATRRADCDFDSALQDTNLCIQKHSQNAGTSFLFDNVPYTNMYPLTAYFMRVFFFNHNEFIFSELTDI